MSQSLTDIAKQLKDSNKKVQLIYAFNGTGKTRLSREFKQLVAPKSDSEDETGTPSLTRSKILYYNAFTEDLFHWDNDLERDADPKLKIQPNAFTKWILQDQGQDQNIIANFQSYSNDRLTPHFNQTYKVKDAVGKERTIEAFSEVTFTMERGNNAQSGSLKISKGEESSFIWSVFYALIHQVVATLNIVEMGNRDTEEFNHLEYVFIDDPVCSLDENHLIELAVQLSQLIKSSTSGLKFIISTHNALFYNVLYNELKPDEGCILRRFEDGSFELEKKRGDSNTCFSYHLHIKQLIEQAVGNKAIQRYHFNLLRNLYEKAASFLGYRSWSDLLPDDKAAYAKRIMHFYSHRSLSNEEVAEPTEPEKQMVSLLLQHLTTQYKFWQQEASHG